MKNKKKLYSILGSISLLAAIVMFNFRNDSHLSELGDFFWAPLPLAVVCFLVAVKSN